MPAGLQAPSTNSFNDCKQHHVACSVCGPLRAAVPTSPRQGPPQNQTEWQPTHRQLHPLRGMAQLGCQSCSGTNGKSQSINQSINTITSTHETACSFSAYSLIHTVLSTVRRHITCIFKVLTETSLLQHQYPVHQLAHNPCCWRRSASRSKSRGHPVLHLQHK